MADRRSGDTVTLANAIELVGTLLERGQVLINFLPTRVSVFYDNSTLESLTLSQLTAISAVIEALGKNVAGLGVSRFRAQSEAPEATALKALVNRDSIIRHRLLAEMNQPVLTGVDVVSTTTHQLIAGGANYLVLTAAVAQGTEQNMLTFLVTNDVARFLIQQVTRALEAAATSEGR